MPETVLSQLASEPQKFLFTVTFTPPSVESCVSEGEEASVQSQQFLLDKFLFLLPTCGASKKPCHVLLERGPRMESCEENSEYLNSNKTRQESCDLSFPSPVQGVHLP